MLKADRAESNMQDVPQLARLLLTVLVEDSLRLRLASAARATALQFAPSVIADRYLSQSLLCLSCPMHHMSAPTAMY